MREAISASLATPRYILMQMHFEYEITPDEYVASQTLYFKLTLGRKRVERGVRWIFAGLFLIAVAWVERSPNWAPILLAAIGVWWIYYGAGNFFPARHFRRAFRGAGLAGKKFKAGVDEDGFEVTGDMCSWRIRWPGVQLKGEDERVIMLSSGGTLFMFGKKYLNDEQVQELRRLSGLNFDNA